MEELQLSLKLSVFITSNRAIWTHCDNIFHQGVNTDSLNHFFMAIKCLHFAEFAYTPENSCAVNRARCKIVRVFSPAKIHNIANMTAHLPRMTPLDELLCFSKLSWEKFQRPDDDHLIIWSRSKKLPIRTKSDHVDGIAMPIQELIFVLWDPPSICLVSVLLVFVFLIH